ncbi:hypothetical protein PTSG_03037, partial [Salpingoeca rosetta]
MGWEEQLWTHTSMVMVGTSNHSDAAMRSSAVTAITVTIAIDCTAAITRRPTTAPIWREADIAHVSRSDEEVSNVREAHEAVELTTMTMTIAGAATADGWLHLDERALCLWAISTTSSSSSFVTNNSGCGRGCGGCIVRRFAVALHDDAAGGGETVTDLFPGPHDTSRAINAHTNVQEKKAQGEMLGLCVCVCVCVCV